jgi:hypothetical protein
VSIAPVVASVVFIASQSWLATARVFVLLSLQNTAESRGSSMSTVSAASNAALMVVELRRAICAVVAVVEFVSCALVAGLKLAAESIAALLLKAVCSIGFGFVACVSFAIVIVVSTMAGGDVSMEMLFTLSMTAPSCIVPGPNWAAAGMARANSKINIRRMGPCFLIFDLLITTRIEKTFF